MKSKVLYFPRGVKVMITPKSVVSDEFRQQIRDSFRDYTWGPAKITVTKTSWHTSI